MIRTIFPQQIPNRSVNQQLTRPMASGSIFALHLLKKRDKIPNTPDSPHLISTISTCLERSIWFSHIFVFDTYRVKSYNLGYGSAEETAKLATSKNAPMRGDFAIQEVGALATSSRGFFEPDEEKIFKPLGSYELRLLSH